jgi:hypothetical protein
MVVPSKRLGAAAKQAHPELRERWLLSLLHQPDEELWACAPLGFGQGGAVFQSPHFCLSSGGPMFRDELTNGLSDMQAWLKVHWLSESREVPVDQTVLNVSEQWGINTENQSCSALDGWDKLHRLQHACCLQVRQEWCAIPFESVRANRAAQSCVGLPWGQRLPQENGDVAWQDTHDIPRLDDLGSHFVSHERSYHLKQWVAIE